MTVTIFSSDDASAPTYTGVAGSVIGILDACLVNGYGAKTALGWAKEFSGTNLAAYRAASGNRLRLRVDDTSTSAARVRGYEVLTAISTGGTGLFPSVAQIPLDANLGAVPKGSGGTSRSWKLIGSTTAFYLLVSPNSTDAAYSAFVDSTLRVVFFGDCTPYKLGDAFATVTIASPTTGAGNDVFGAVNNGVSLSTHTGHYIARPHIQIGGSLQVGKATVFPSFVVTNILGGAVSAAVPLPDPVLGEMLVSPIDIYEVVSLSASRRCRLPGAYVTPHGPIFGAFDTIVGTGDLAGKTLLNIPCYTSSSVGQFLLDITPAGW
jgi:hypothetical protein